MEITDGRMSGLSWKTTLSAAISAFGSFVLFSGQLHYVEWPQWVLALAMFASIGGLAGLGISSKDYNVTGGGTTTNSQVFMGVAAPPQAAALPPPAVAPAPTVLPTPSQPVLPAPPVTPTGVKVEI